MLTSAVACHSIPQQTSKMTIAVQVAPLLDDYSYHDTAPTVETLGAQLDITANLHYRVGLVPNYFMTRGEAISGCSCEAIVRKIVEKIFKLFHYKDFREEDSYAEFERALSSASSCMQEDEFRQAVNRKRYKGKNTLLHTLVQKRHLKFVRTLLLYAGDMIDFGIKNKQGYTAMDLAVDRLEVEMIYLFLLYGAEISDITSNSLGYREWITYDLFNNLDTGRWLHKTTEQAIIEHATTCISPSFCEELKRWACGGTMEDETLQRLGRLPNLFALTLADGCDAITNNEACATLVRHVAVCRERSTQIEASSSTSMLQNIKIETPTECSDLNELLQAMGASTQAFKVAGRTLFYRCDDGNEVAVKFSKSSEENRETHPLAKEAALNKMVCDLKGSFQLRSEYPETLELLRLKEVPEDIVHAIQGQSSKGYHSFSISDNPSGVLALVYRPPNGYTHYVNDPSLELANCRDGIMKAAYDAAVLAQHGLYHGTLVDIQHDSSREQRPHLWSFETFLTRFRGGSGRIERGFAGLAAPNVRASGLADLKHIIDFEGIRVRFDPSHIHAQHNILYDDNERFKVSMIEQIGSSLFATVLLVASAWSSRHLNGIAPAENLDLTKELEACFSSFVQGYLGFDDARSTHFLSLCGVNFALMADQIEMFTTPKYVEVAETAQRRPFFGILAKMLGFLTHPTAFVHFAQRGALPVDSLEEIKVIYTPQDSNLPHPRVDTSKMRCSPTWKRGQGWVSPDGQPHLGAYEGVLPFQQLIRDLYSVVHLAWLVRTYQQEPHDLV